MLSTLLISFKCKSWNTPIEFHIKIKVLICPNSLSSPFVFYSFLLADKPCFLYIHLSVLWFQCYCITLSRAFHPHTGIYMFVPSPSLLVILKTFSNCNIYLFTSFKAIKQNLTFLSFDKKSIPESLLSSPYKRADSPQIFSLMNRDHGSI